MKSKKTVLIVVAHADDLEFMAAGTVARFTGELGYDVYEYILTDNSKGSYRLSSEELIDVSAQEACVAGEILGIREVRLEGYSDGDLQDVPPGVLRSHIMALIREVQADIVMSWDPFAPYEDHPDHRVVALATLDAASFSGNPLFHPEHAHPPYPVTEAYWFAKSPWNAKLYVDITETMDTKLEALLAHVCQMELTYDGLQREAELLGVDISGLAGEGYRPLIEYGVRQYCAAAGQAAGVAYAELFRYERLGMLYLLLGPEQFKSDFA
jgi:LmbE family N-acetylglucosaminyl deacetylase